MPGESSTSVTPEGLTALIQSILQQSQSQAITIAIIQRDLSDVKNEAIKTATLLKEGAAGQPSLLVRSALMEKTLSETSASMQELRKMLESRASEDQKGRWQIATTVISGLLALTSAIVAALLAWNK